MSSIREEDFYKAVDTILVEFEGVENLNEQQRNSFYNLIQHRDVFTVLPTVIYILRKDYNLCFLNY